MYQKQGMKLQPLMRDFHITATIRDQEPQAKPPLLGPQALDRNPTYASTEEKDHHHFLTF